MLEAGMRVPADCLIISSNNLKVDENAHDEATIMKNKEPFVDGKSGDPFLRANMSVMSGNAKVLVCCVGKSSTRDFNMARLEEMTNEDTPL
jgi:magnesium-transporting ATPase (P-type)